MNSNQNVNSTMDGFTAKLLGIQKEIQNLEAMKNMFNWNSTFEVNIYSSF